MRDLLLREGVSLAKAQPRQAREAPDDVVAQGRIGPLEQVPARDTKRQQGDANREASMTPEQRRQLRRDVADHGRDIYGRPNPNKQ